MTTYEELSIIKANESVIPADCLSFAEQAMYVAEYAQKEFNNLFEAVGVEELAVFESTGFEMVYEGAKLDAFKDKAVNFFKKIWAAIKGAYERVYAFFIQKSKTAMSQITGIEKADVSAVIKANPDKNYGVTHNYDELIKNYETKIEAADSLQKEINSKFSNVDGIIISAKTFVKPFFKADSSKMEEAEKVRDELTDKIFTTFGDKDSKSYSDIRTAIRKDIKEVKVNGSFLNANFKKMIEIVKGGKSIDEIKKAYKEQKKNIDDTIGSIKGLKEENMRTAATRVAVLGKLSNALEACANTYFDVFKKRFTEYLLILVRVWKDSKKVKKEAKNESVEYTSYSADMVSEAFDW